VSFWIQKKFIERIKKDVTKRRIESAMVYEVDEHYLKKASESFDSLIFSKGFKDIMTQTFNY